MFLLSGAIILGRDLARRISYGKIDLINSVDDCNSGCIRNSPDTSTCMHSLRTAIQLFCRA